MMRRLGAALAAAIIAYAAMADVTGIITPLGGGLPSQTGNSGKYLTTNGSVPSWATVAGGGGAFSSLTTGTNTAAAMLVGTGASLGATGSGTITATAVPATGITGTINATQVNGAAIPASAAVLSSNASNQIVAATTTGSGNNVLATSPTLVTPALGTPSSVVLTSATGLPLTSGVTGILPVANGGNGTATPANTASAGVAVTGTWPAQAFSVDQTFVPTWTGLHTHAPTMVANTVSSAEREFTNQTASAGNQFYSPALEFDGQGWATTPVASQPIACRIYLLTVQGTTNPSANWTFDCNTNGAGAANILTLPNVANGTATLFASLTTNAVRVQGATVPTNGIYNPTTNVLGFATNGTARGSIGTKGEFTLVNGILDTGTKFTAAGTGCTIATTVGGATTGTFTLATGPCTSVVLTMAGATGITAANGWSCQAHDKTAPTVLIGGESASTTTTATITIPAGAGTADVISFHCDGY